MPRPMPAARPWHPADPIHPLILHASNTSQERAAQNAVDDARRAEHGRRAASAVAACSYPASAATTAEVAETSDKSLDASLTECYLDRGVARS
jgi:hypothetical protein